MRKLTAIFVSIIAAVGSAFAATYYVDEVNGVDDATRNGGPGDPWRTITYAISRTSGGNTFMCRGTFEEEVWVAYGYGSRCVFTANPEATLVGRIACDYRTNADLNDFDVYGSAHGGAQAEVSAARCYFNYPGGEALAAGGRSGDLRLTDCTFENCGYIIRQMFEFGLVRFTDCSIADCAEGISTGGELILRLERTNFRRVTGTALSFSLMGDLQINECGFTACGGGVFTSGPGSPAMPSAYLAIKNSVFRGNGLGLSLNRTPFESDELYVEDNVICENDGNGLELEGEFVVRGNVVEDNGGHGVYVTRYRADLGTPGDPGGNTFAGSGSGYDVYNASPEDVPAYGNTWDAASEAEMAGKTWAEVNVTRIYDHWDDPSVGYVMWSLPMSGVAPASLGRIKASFRGEEADSTAPAGAFVH